MHNKSRATSSTVVNANTENTVVSSQSEPNTDPEGFTLPKEHKKALRDRARQLMKRQGKRLERSTDDLESDLAEVQQSSKHQQRASGSLEGPPDVTSEKEYPPLHPVGQLAGATSIPPPPAAPLFLPQ